MVNDDLSDVSEDEDEYDPDEDFDPNDTNSPAGARDLD